MNKIILSLCLLFSISSFSCSTKKETKKVEPIKQETKKQVEQQVEKKVVEKQYKRLPSEIVKTIFTECNSLDITFYEGDKTINLWDDNVKYILSMIAGDTPSSLDNNIVGHIMVLKDGDVMTFKGYELTLVEISMKGNNNYVIYNFNKKEGDKTITAKYYNNINKKGIDFFNKMLGKTK